MEPANGGLIPSKNQNWEKGGLGMKGKMFALIVTILFLVSAISPAYAATVSWKGVTWNDPYGALSLNAAGNLVVEEEYWDLRTDKGTPPPMGEGKGKLGWGAAHYNTPSAFRSASVQWVEATFIEDGQGTVGHQIWIEDESWGVPGDDNDHLWIQFGAWEWTPSYGIYLWDAETDDDLFVNTHIPRTNGVHSLKIMKNADETVSFYFDGELIYTSASEFGLDYLGDVYLAANSNWRGSVKADGHNPHNVVDSGIYTDYTTGTA
jgi:hypothetical protein